MGIFKACDVRGVYPAEIDEAMAESIGAAVGTELGGGTCVVGGDVRLSTPALKDALCAGLRMAGADVVDLGVLPTPAVYWAQRSLGVQGAVIVTASHNPPEYNGVKFMLGFTPVTPEDVAGIERRVRERDFSAGRGSYRERAVKKEYLAWLEGRFAGTGAGLRVLVDAANGSTSQWAPDAFRGAGYDVEELNCEPDGTFPNRSPNPSQPGSLAGAGREVKSRGVDFAACFDGDGDRVVFLDEAGSVVESDQAIIILARRILEQRPGASVVYDLKCTNRVPEQIKAAGGRAIRERSGHAFIKARLLEEGAAFGGEASGHFFFGEIGGDDGLYAALVMGELVRGSGRALSRLVAAVPRYCISPDIRIPRPHGDGAQVVERLKKEFADYPQDYTDGVRIEFGDGWALCRVSVTEPVITLRFEADTAEQLKEIKEAVLSRVQL